MVLSDANWSDICSTLHLSIVFHVRFQSDNCFSIYAHNKTHIYILLLLLYIYTLNKLILCYDKRCFVLSTQKNALTTTRTSITLLLNIITIELIETRTEMNSLVSADYGSSSDSNDENTQSKTISSNNYGKNFLRSLSDAENDIKDNNDCDHDDDSDSSVERSKSR